MKTYNEKYCSIYSRNISVSFTSRAVATWLACMAKECNAFCQDQFGLYQTHPCSRAALVGTISLETENNFQVTSIIPSLSTWTDKLVYLCIFIGICFWHVLYRNVGSLHLQIILLDNKTKAVEVTYLVSGTNVCQVYQSFIFRLLEDTMIRAWW